MFDDARLKLLLQTNRKPLSIATLLVWQCIGQSAPHSKTYRYLLWQLFKRRTCEINSKDSGIVLRVDALSSANDNLQVAQSHIFLSAIVIRNSVLESGSLGGEREKKRIALATEERNNQLTSPGSTAWPCSGRTCSTLLPIYSTDMGRSAFTECLLLGELAPSC